MNSLNFLGKQLLVHFIWIIPAIYLCWGHFTLSLFLFSTLVTYFFLIWTKWRSGDYVAMKKGPWIIWATYYLAICAFLYLTGFATFEGIVNVFGLVSPVKWSFALVFAAGIAITLLVLTMILKERRKPQVVFAAIVLYGLFDGMTALPFNFLFFYENLNRAAETEKDKESLERVLQITDSILQPKQKDSWTEGKKLQVGDSIKQSKRDAEYDGEIKRISKDLREGNITDSAYNYKYAKAERKYNRGGGGGVLTQQVDLIVNSVNYDGMLDTLKLLRESKLLLENEAHAGKARLLAAQMKAQLASLCRASDDSVLVAAAETLQSPRMSPLESIKLLYQFLGGVLVGKSDEVLGSAGLPKDAALLIHISLASSIVIDILPLLLSLLYAAYKRSA
jgi:hypothetical protein